MTEFDGGDGVWEWCIGREITIENGAVDGWR